MADSAPLVGKTQDKPVAKRDLPQVHTTGKPAQTAETAGKRGSKSAPAPRPDGWRETVESVVVAFILAFLFRTFEAEAFIIPTGSMAPTLYGQHRDVYCAKCGTRFAVGLNSEPAQDAEVRGGVINRWNRSHFAICPNAGCRYPNDVLTREMFAGDRILVNKFPYEFGEPERWDVVVFKFPGGAKTNYIKRLAGLPGEELMIVNGDVKVRPLGKTNEPFQIPRKNPDKQKALQLLVQDNDHPARELLEAGWPESWAPVGDVAWSSDAESRSFRFDAPPAGAESWQWLRYSHYIPTADDWTKVIAKQPLRLQPEPELIRDFYAYNSRITAREAEDAVSRGKLPDLSSQDKGKQWVGDLTINCTLEVLAAEGEVVFELVEGSRRYRLTIDLQNGRGAFSFQHEEDRDGDTFGPAGEPFETLIKGTGEHEISFANVDDRLCAWVDGRLVKDLEFNPEPSRYQPQAAPIEPTERDKSPVGIGARAAKLRISHLRLERDISYLNEGPVASGAGGGTYKLHDYADDLQDEFLMLGDNSPRSRDSRVWDTPPAVPRRLLIGKAFYIYWPHAIPFMNGGQGYPVRSYYEEKDGRERGHSKDSIPKFSLPFYPQFGRMIRIR